MLVFLKKKEVKLILIYFVKLDRSNIFTQPCMGDD